MVDATRAWKLEIAELKAAAHPGATHPAATPAIVAAETDVATKRVKTVTIATTETATIVAFVCWQELFPRVAATMQVIQLAGGEVSQATSVHAISDCPTVCLVGWSHRDAAVRVAHHSASTM